MSLGVTVIQLHGLSRHGLDERPRRGLTPGKEHIPDIAHCVDDPWPGHRGIELDGLAGELFLPLRYPPR